MVKPALWALLALACTSAAADEYVRGYVDRNGNYVAPHYRSSPNSTPMDNWSTQGNVNPYTGQAGHVNPYAPAPMYTPPAYQAPRVQPIQPMRCGWYNGQYICG